MEFPRKDNIRLENTLKPLRFQVYDWFVPEADKSVKKLQADARKRGEPIQYPDEAPLYEIYMFGCTEEGHSVCAKVEDFIPYFYVRIPDNIVKSVKSLQDFANEFYMYLVNEQYKDLRTGRMRNIIYYKMQSHLVAVDIVHKKEFYGFTNNQDFAYLKISVKSLGLYNALRFFLKNPPIEFLKKFKEPFPLYESNLDPFLRFIHVQNIQPCGWVELPGGSYQLIANGCENDTFSRANFTVSVNYRMVKPYESTKTAPILIVSFDLECTSSHGDFPVSKKDYRKLAQDLYQVARFETMNAEALKKAILEAYKHEVTCPNGSTIHKLYPLQKINSDKVESKLDAILPEVLELMRKIHTMDDEDEDEEEEEQPKMAMSKMKLEYENDLNRILSKVLPKLQGDAIIQIGTTVHRYGSDEIIYRHIHTLKSCDRIEGVHVSCYENEGDMLLSWKGLIQQLDPDILTGYNIFGFDMPYLWDRAQELELSQFGVGFGRLAERDCQLLEQKLASSALGENFMYYLDLDGIVCIDMYKVMQRDHKLDSYKLDYVAQMFLGDRKNDLPPNEIFAKYLGTSADRKIIAEYCIQDCALVNRIFHKLKVLENNVGMGNVCSVPLSYLFMRGQGIKIFSLVANECRKNNFVIPVLSNWREDNEKIDEVGYEGAIVLPPKEGMYLDDYIVTLDFASLYPSSMIERNLSHDCYVNDPKYDDLPGIDYKTITYDLYEGTGDEKTKIGEQVCKFVQLQNGEKGIIPRILMMLLKQRKVTRKKMEYETLMTADGSYSGLIKETDEMFVIQDVEKNTSVSIAKSAVLERKATYDPFEQAVLDALQLAYKVTANSLYGQIGSRTSQIYLKDIAACTTATGRERIMHAKEFVEKAYGTDVIYGDTDSLFCRFNVVDDQGNKLKGLEGLAKAIEMGQIASAAINKTLPAPQNLEYEKTFYPFIIFSKKRYVGNLYEDDAYKKPKQKSMGIVLKRRDNAPLVKKIYGGIINILLNEANLEKSVNFLTQELTKLVNNEYPLEDFIITKTLKSNYKDPTKIAHKVLADRMADRDPGNKPQVNDRIPFIYIQTPPEMEVKLQGDRIEHPDYIRQNQLVPDYQFYITNQLIKPICQLYALCVEKLPNYSNPPNHWEQVDEELKVRTIYADSEKKRQNRIQALRQREVEMLLFEPFLTKKKPRAKKEPGERVKKALPLIQNERITENAPTLTVEVTENKEAKLFIGKVQMIHNEQMIWEETYTLEKKPKLNKSLTEAYQRVMYDMLKKYVPEYKSLWMEYGLKIKIHTTRFKNSLAKTLADYNEVIKKIEEANKNMDVESLQEAHEMQKNILIAEALSQIHCMLI
jgi:DNA polymerase delta subunit 1